MIIINPMDYPENLIGRLLPDERNVSRCMDDRPGEGNGVQIPGGIYGITTSLVLAAEAQKPGFVDIVGQYGDMDKFTAFIASLLNKRDGSANNHQLHAGCAAWLLSRSITDSLYQRPEKAKATAQLILPGGSIVQPDAESIFMASETLANSDLIAPDSNRASRILLDPITKKIGPDHRAGDLVVMHDLDHHNSLDTTKAWLQETPAYGLNVGMWQELGRRTSNEISTYLGPIDENTFALAALLYASATVNALDWKTPDRNPRIHHVNYDLVA